MSIRSRYSSLKVLDTQLLVKLLNILQPIVISLITAMDAAATNIWACWMTAHAQELQSLLVTKFMIQQRRARTEEKHLNQMLWELRVWLWRLQKTIENNGKMTCLRANAIYNENVRYLFPVLSLYSSLAHYGEGPRQLRSWHAFLLIRN